MSVWSVFVEGWQIECCGTPVTIGDVPDEVPATTGTVRRIEVVTTTFTCDVPGGNIWRPVPDTSQRKVVTTSPKWFSDEFPSDHAGTQTSSDSQIGVLVSLEVADQRMPG